MKNLFIYSGIALVVLANSTEMLFDIKKEIGFYQDSKKEIIVSKDFKALVSKEYSSNSKKISSMKETTVLKSKTLFLRNFPKTTVNKTIAEDEPIEVVSTTKMNKTADELITDDNLITENNISNETQPLDFDVINGNEVVESANTFKTEKTADQLIAEDNAITANNISNEIQSLDFDIINGNEVVESVNTFKTEKTADQFFSEDNLITENNISNETQSLDFEIINKIAKPRN